jgi:hypothetical protein
MMVLPFGLLPVRKSIPPVAAARGRLLPDARPLWKEVLRDGHSGDVFEQTYYRWRTKYGGMDPQMARQLQELQKENARLKRLVADQALDNQILREAARPNW